MTKKWKKIFKTCAVIAVSPVLFFIILAMMLYIPFVQNFLVDRVTEKLSEDTGMEISVDNVRLAFPLDLAINDVKIIKPLADGKRDTIADVHSIIADVKLMPLFNGMIDIEDFIFEKAVVNTDDFIASVKIKGSIDKFYLKSRGVDLSNEEVTINRAALDGADITVMLTDSVSEEDTTSAPTKWKILASDFSISKSRLRLIMAGDTISAGAYLDEFMVKDADIDLGRSIFKVNHISADNSSLKYDNVYADSIPGLDYNHISLTGFRLSADSLCYSAASTHALLSDLAFKERSGINLTQLKGRVMMDSLTVHVPELRCTTDNSDILLTADMDFSSFDDKRNDGKCNALINGTFGKQDIMLFLGDMPDNFRRGWPSQPLRLMASCSGNVRNIRVNRLSAELPTAFDISASGNVTGVTRKIGGKLDMDMKTYDLAFVTSLIDYPVQIPQLTGNALVNFSGSRYDADLSLLQKDSCGIYARAFFDTASKAYEASVDVDDVDVSRFLPEDSIYNVNASLSIKGNNIDLLSRYTDLEFDAELDNIQYGSTLLNGFKMRGRLDDGHAIADVVSNNDYMKGRVTFDALLSKEILRTTLTCDIIKADLQKIGLYKTPVTAGICAHVDLDTDMNEYFKINGYMNDITIREEDKVHRPRSIQMNVNTSADTTFADIKSGDLDLFVDADGGIRRLITVGDTLISKLNQQFAARVIDQRDIISCLPTANIKVHAGKNNFFAKLLNYHGYEYENADMNLNISPKTGLNGNIDILELQMGDALLDSINFAVMSDSTECRYKARIKNNLNNPQYVFTALSDGYVFDRGLGFNLKYLDRGVDVGLDVGMKASMLDRGIKCEMSKLDPIIGYTRFKVNEKNHIYLDRTGRISADVKFIAPDGTGFMLFSDDENLTASQDLTLSLYKMDLGKIFSVIPYLPQITGILNGDFHMVSENDVTTMSASAFVNQMTYEKSPMGNIGTELVYMPLNDGSHFIDGRFSQNDREIAVATGRYIPEGSDNLDLKLELLRFPMDITNGLFPYHLLGLHGFAEGELKVKGTTSRPKVDGELFLDSSYVESVPFGVAMRFANDPVRIVGSNLLFENFELFSNNDNPLDLYGTLDFSNLDDVKMDIKMQAHEFLLIDSKEKKYSVAFGKAMVDFYGMIKGPMNNLKMTGLLDVLSSTDLVYILRDSPLSTDNRMDDLVKFVNFKDTARVEKERPELSGLDMDMHVVVQDGAHVVCNLNADKTNYIDLMGGGRLRMQYNVLDDFRLTGKYTLSSGEMKYSLPVIPLKTFAITDGSYVEFTGDAGNPHLNITATERTTASVGSEDGSTRNVAFDCGVEVTRTLNDMGLKFIISAPEDMTVQNQLASMSEEQRGKLAVTMLTTGMYLSDGNTSAFSMNNALSSFLQSEINQIASSAMKTMDVSVGVDNSVNAAGAQHTDYSFKFAKRFWNNRMKIIVGGSVSTGAETERSNNTFFDNVSFEYRLDKSATKNLRMFYERDSYDLLEGEVSEYGVGFVWRKRMHHLMDLFRKEKKQNLFEEENKPLRKEEKEAPGTSTSDEDDKKPAGHEKDAAVASETDTSVKPQKPYDKDKDAGSTEKEE